uniref:Ataxin 7 like 1 n=1 Tax=Macaca mulatta TaxID=9544 RepID=A0A1D5QY95_MACMU
LLTPQTHLHFRTTSTHWFQLPEQQLQNLHGPKSSRKEKKGVTGVKAGRRGHQGPFPGSGGGGGRNPSRLLPAKPSGLPRRRLAVGDRDPGREGQAGSKGCLQKLSVLQRQLCGKDHPSFGPASGLSPCAPTPGTPGSGGAAASRLPGALQPPLSGTRRSPVSAAPPRQAGGPRRAGGRGLQAPLCCPWRPRARKPHRAGSGSQSARPSSAPSPLLLRRPPPIPPFLPPSPFQNTQCRNVPKMTSERSRIPCLSAAAAEGTGKKQQEGRAMATLDRKVPSPEAFLGKPWSSWIDAAKLHCSDNVDLEEAGKEGGKSREVMRLNKEDMHLFGHYPAHDDFYLVVCSACNQVVKPQVFQSHCGRKQDNKRNEGISGSGPESSQAIEKHQV